ncbi:MAG: hypothetical protein ABS52_16550 [Gemmatimonadetes bacterium SCN 70-22]|nr:MAG: hypothetical protein ABS52_16550 [Gemmatimonadetes bacterium SCN 70-22]
MSGATSPNGAQLSTWRQRGRDAAAQRREHRQARHARRLETWYQWARGFVRSGRRFQATHTTHRDRAQLCAAHGVPNTGRQWRKLRKALARQGRAS